MPEHFANEGYGWTCLRCSDEESSKERARSSEEDGRARFFREGEAEEREGAALSSRTLARWREEGARRFLRCPLCGTEEEFKGAR